MKMTEEKRFKVVAEMVQQYCGVPIEQMNENSDIIELGVNHLDLSVLLDEVAEEFEVDSLPQEAYQKVRTIGDIMFYTKKNY